MLTAFARFWTEQPVPIALVGAHYLVYALPAWIVVISRAATRRMSRREWSLFAVFAVAMAAEFIQLGADGFDFSGAQTWGLPRYFGVFAPLLWLWTAWAVAELWRRHWAAKAAIAAALVCLFAVQDIRSFAAFYGKGARHDALVAARRITPVILADYKGPRRQSETRRTLAEYFTSRRPVVFGDFSAAAWMVRGQSEGALQGRGLCPYDEDYIFYRVGTGYGGAISLDPEKYDFVKQVPGGLRTQWRLYRKKQKKKNGN